MEISEQTEISQLVSMAGLDRLDATIQRMLTGRYAVHLGHPIQPDASSRTSDSDQFGDFFRDG